MPSSRLLPVLRSPRLTLALLLALVPAAALGVSRAPLLLLLGALLTANVVACTVQRVGRARGRVAALADLAMHLSVVLIIAGGVAKAALGTVRTAVVAVGTETAAAYDWGASGERPLGFRLRVTKLDLGHYPFRALVGTRDAVTKEKTGLVEVGEGLGAVASTGGVSVAYLDADRDAGTARFEVTTPAARGTLRLGLKGGPASSSDFGGVGLTLVAFRDEVKTVSALVRVVLPDGRTTEASLSPNARLAVEGTNVCLTAWGKDEFGNPYAGFQVSRDPGAPLFWGGCILLAIAVPVHFVLKARRRRDS